MAHTPLCLSCLATPFASLFITPQRDVPLLTLAQIWSQTGCRFCNLLKHTLVNYYGAEYMENKVKDDPEMLFFASQSPVDPRCDWNKIYREIVTAPLYLEINARGDKGGSLERVAKKANDEFNESQFLPKIQLFRPDGDTSTRAYGKATLPGAVDWDYIRDWITTCDGKHAGAGTTELASLPLLAVDVDKMCIVPMPPGHVRYIALSYMWGKDQSVKLKRDNYRLLTTQGTLGKNGLAPSRTIRDAIRVAEQLKCRYLWIDALCIIQDDPAHLRANVGAMDKVYAGAWLTIVAAAGDDADGGLPGVYHDLPRSGTQLRVDILQKDGSLITVGNMLDSANAALNFSTWDTRGWTYQERVLSRRLLSFTNSQVYFYCDRGCSCREDMHPLISLDDDEDAGLGSMNAGYELSFEYDDLFTLYASAVARYTQRHLTNPADKVVAFQGFLNRLSGPFRGPFTAGLPLTVFDAGLLWEPTGRCTRAGRAFPSWSWAGWDGAVRYAMNDSMTNFCECVLSLATVETSTGVRLSTESSGAQFSPVREDGTSWTRCIDEDTQEIYYTTSDASGRDYRYPRPIPSMDYVDSQQGATEDAVDHNLRIRGLVAICLVSDQHSSTGWLLSTCHKGTHTHCRLQLLDSANRVTGYVLVDAQEVPQILGKKHRFLALSRSTLYRLDDDPSWDPETRSFRSWTHPESGCPGSEDEISDSEGDDGELWSTRNELFDEEAFNPRVFWPVVNVLMLSVARADGVVERVGIGKAHVDGFLPIAAQEEILLG